jgi:hypothetical protein
MGSAGEGHERERGGVRKAKGEQGKEIKNQIKDRGECRCRYRTDETVQYYYRYYV